jgi:hypothetical protein
MKEYGEAIDQNGVCFSILKKKFPSLGEAKGKEGIYVGPHIREERFLNHVNLKVRPDSAFKAVATDFLGNLRAEN